MNILLSLITDKRFYKKLSCFLALLFIGNFSRDLLFWNFVKNLYLILLIIFIQTISITIPYGYIIKTLNLFITKEEYKLAEFEYLNDFKLGFKYFIAILLPLLLFGVFKFTLLHINKLFYASIEMYCIYTFLLIFFFLAPAFTWIFAVKQHWKSFLLLNRAILLIKNNLWLYIKTFIILFLLIVLITVVKLPFEEIVSNLIPNDFIFMSLFAIIDTIQVALFTIIFLVLITKTIKKDYIDMI